MKSANLHLYVITSFLCKERLSALVAQCRECGFACSWRETADQTGEIYGAWHVNANGVPLILAPANSYHYDGDFEIGVTTTTRADWEEFLSAAHAAGLALETSADDTCFYAIPKVEHGAFFMIFDEKTSSAANGKAVSTSLSATLPASDLALYTEKIQPLLSPTLASALHFDAGARFALHSIAIRTSKGAVTLCH